ncbi:hypothetical protein QE152_g33634 [Popillia japonica]|uniref:Uncharacterized protein n=1 Tax=Popillia japonica TaxID=7064 RepID=A0AAW1IWJ3_POPJA
MAGIPSTLLIKSTNEELLPPRMLFVVCKQLFRYGVKTIVMKDSQIHVMSLTYTAKGETLAKKFENLPVDYVRLALESSEEISLFEEALRRFNFNFNAKGDDMDAVEDGPPPPKIKCIITPSEEESTMVRRKPNKLKLKLLENRSVTPASSSKIREVYDDDADDHNAQKFHYEIIQ